MVASQLITPPFPVFTDLTGEPLENGKIYIGEATLEPIANPITVYYDDALTIPATQPIRTHSGYPYYQGTPTNLYIAEDDYSITVKTASNIQVFTNRTIFGVTGLRADLAAPTGSSLIGFIQTGTGATARTVEDELRDTVKLAQFLPDNYVTNGSVDYTAEIEDARVRAIGKKLIFPDGIDILYSSPLTFSSSVDFAGCRLIYAGPTDQFALTLNATPAGELFKPASVYSNVTVFSSSTDTTNRTHGICIGGSLGKLLNARVIGFTGVSLGLGTGANAYTGATFSATSIALYWDIECQVSSTAGWNLVTNGSCNANNFFGFTTFPYNGFNTAPPRAYNCIDQIVLSGLGNQFYGATLEASQSGYAVRFQPTANANVFHGDTYYEVNSSFLTPPFPRVLAEAQSSANVLSLRHPYTGRAISDLGTANKIKCVPSFYINGQQELPAAASTNLLTNGDFVNGLTSWTDLSTNTVPTFVAGYVNGQALRVDTTNGGPLYEQNVTTIGGYAVAALIGKDVTVSGWIKTNFVNGSGVPQMCIQINGLTQALVPADDAIYFYSSTIKIPAGATSVTVRVRTASGGLTGYAEISNLSLVVGTEPLAIAPKSKLKGSATYNPPSIASGAQASTTVTVTGAALGDYARAAFSLDLGGLVLSAYVSAANTVTCVFTNLSGAPIDLASGTLSAVVTKA